MQNSRSVRLRRAIKIAALLGVLVSIPVAYRAWLEAEAGKVARPNLGEVSSFSFRDQAGQLYSRDSLRKGLVIYFHFPDACAPQSTKMVGCETARKQSLEYAQWFDSQLTIHHAEEDNPLYRFVYGNRDGFSKEWLSLAAAPPSGSLVPESFDLSRPLLVVIDPWMTFAGAWYLDQEVPLGEVQRVTSKASFEQYLGNYLARRTFMGPKREAQK